MKKLLIGLMLLGSTIFAKEQYLGRIVDINSDSCINMTTVSNQGSIRIYRGFYNNGVIFDKDAMEFFKCTGTVNGLLLFYDDDTSDYIVRVEKGGRHNEELQQNK